MLILTHAKILTLWEKTPQAEALAVRDGHIVAVGSNDQVSNLADGDGQVIDLAGQTVWPGLTDAHLHLQNYAASLQFVDCETPTREECLQRVAARARETAAGAWIIGHGWNHNDWPEGYGTAAMLDQVAPHNPVFLTAKSLHAAWANSQALALAGITAQTPDPHDGQFQRDESGAPSGILLEEAMGAVYDAIPDSSSQEIASAIRKAQSRLWSFGLTGVHDFDARNCFRALQLLDQAGELKLRVLKGIMLDDLEQAIGLGLRTGFGGEFLRVGSVKCFADGALGPQTAAMIAPYQGSADGYGQLSLDTERIYQIGQKAVESGLSLAIHAIGDRANREVIRAYRKIRVYEEEQHLAHFRHRIEHVQLLDPGDMEQLAQLDIIASVQPIHATSDMLMADRYWGERSRYAYAYGSLLANHTRLAFGSDAPVESPNPFWGLHAAVTRRRRDGSPSEDGWYSQQRLPLMDALRAYTVQAAYAAGREERQGRLAPGYCADLIVLPVDPRELPSQELFAVRPTRTMVAGEWVWERGMNE
jgi:predicted amidohydrolase YtcJ